MPPRPGGVAMATMVSSRFMASERHDLVVIRRFRRLRVVIEIAMLRQLPKAKGDYLGCLPHLARSMPYSRKTTALTASGEAWSIVPNPVIRIRQNEIYLHFFGELH